MCSPKTAPITTEAVDIPTRRPTEYVYLGPGSRFFDLVHVEMDLQVDPVQEKVEGMAQLTLTPVFFSQQFVSMEANSLLIQSVFLKEGDTSQKLHYVHEDGNLEIDLGRLVKKADTVTLGIEFAHQSGEIPAAHEEVVYFETAPACYSMDVWFPVPVHVSENYSQTVRLMVDTSYMTVGNGEMVNSVKEGPARVDTWSVDRLGSSVSSFFAVGAWTEHAYSNINLFSQSQQAPDFLLKKIDTVQRFLETYTGTSFQFPQLNVLITSESDPVIETFGSVLVINEKGLVVNDTILFETVLVNALASQWFGHTTVPASESESAFIGGIASYFEYVWVEEHYGSDRANELLLTNWLTFLNSQASHLAVSSREIQENDIEKLDDLWYKSAYIFHDLRSQTGDEAFFEGLKTLLQIKDNSGIGLQDYQKVMERVTGLDLGWYFDQWFRQQGHPALQVEHAFYQDTLHLTVNQKSPDAYYLPLYLDVKMDTSYRRYDVVVEKPYHHFRIPGINPEMIVLNSSHTSPIVIDHAKGISELWNQLDAGEMVQTRYEGAVKLLNSALSADSLYMVLQLLLIDESELVRLKALERLSLMELPPSGLESQLKQRIAMGGQAEASLAFQILLANSDLNLSELQLYLDHRYGPVRGLALAHLLTILREPQRTDLVDRFRPSNDVNTINALGNYFNQYHPVNNSGWYLSKTASVHYHEQIYLVYLVTEYLKKCPKPEIGELHDWLYQTALNHRDAETRLAAFRGMVELSNRVGNGAQRGHVKLQEKDSGLIQLYSRF